ncbi:LysR family transcriptional regulator [Roseomonas sp. WA12]
MMLLRQIRCFLAVAGAHSFTAAAARLHLSQPALGGQVRRLEEHLGVTLFERHARGIRLTPVGAAFLPRAQAVLAAAEAAERAMEGFRGAAPRSLRLGVSPTPGQALVPDLLRLLALGPTPLQLTLRQGMSDELGAEVAAGGLDAALCYDPLSGIGTALPLYAEDLFLVGPRTLLGPPDDIAFTDLPGIPLLLEGRAHATRRMIEHLASAEGVALSVSLEIGPVDMKRAVMKAHGGCATLVPYGLFLDEIRAGRLTARRVVRPRISRTLTLLTRPGLAETLALPLGETLRSLVQERIRAGGLGWEALGGEAPC